MGRARFAGTPGDALNPGKIVREFRKSSGPPAVQKNMRILGLALAFLAGCRTIHDDLAELRAEITRLERDVPPDAPLWIDDGPNAFALFLEDFSPRIPDFVYNHVAATLAKMPDADIRAQVKGAFSVPECLEDPSRFRGRFWKIHGPIGNLEPQPVGERGLGFAETFSGVLFMDGRPVLFHLIEKPEVAFIGEDVVQADAIFLKIVRYRARNGRDIDAPFLMGRRMGQYY